MDTQSDLDIIFRLSYEIAKLKSKRFHSKRKLARLHKDLRYRIGQQLMVIDEDYRKAAMKNPK